MFVTNLIYGPQVHFIYICRGSKVALWGEPGTKVYWVIHELLTVDSYCITTLRIGA